MGTSKRPHLPPLPHRRPECLRLRLCRRNSRSWRLSACWTGGQRMTALKVLASETRWNEVFRMIERAVERAESHAVDVERGWTDQQRLDSIHSGHFMEER